MVENYDVRNAYVDTSYVRFSDGAVIVSSFSSDDGNVQQRAITNKFRVTANEGYKFDLDTLDDYYFDVQFVPFTTGLEPIPDDTLSWVRVKLSEFVPTTEITDFEWIEKTHGYILYSGISRDSMMYYTHTVGDTEHLILLYGGLRERDLMFFSFTKRKSEYQKKAFTIDGKDWILSDLFGGKYFDWDTYEDLELNFLNNLNFVAIPSSASPIEDTSKYLFNTYYIDNVDLSILKENTNLVNDVIINTYSYPVNFSDGELVEVDFSVANITQSIPAKRFLKNNSTIEIFRFTIPDIPNVTEVRIRIPFNNDVKLYYEEVKGKTIIGRFVYEVLTNSTTLFINDGTVDIYKAMVGIGVVVPYKPTGAYDVGNEPTTRLAVDEPKLFVKGVGQTIKGNYIQGSIGKVVENMLNSERSKLNSLLKDGVYFND